jgi:hypothetical protein
VQALKNEVVRWVFGVRKVDGVGENGVRRFFTCTPHKIISAITSRRIREAGNMARKSYNETHTEFWLGNLKERDHFEDPGADIRAT